MWRGLRAVSVVVGAIGLAQVSGGVAMTARNGAAAGLVVAGLGTTLLVLAVILVRINRRTRSDGVVPPDASHMPPTMEMPIWTPRHVPPSIGEETPRSATWAVLEEMRADAINEAAREAQARGEAVRHAPPRGSTPPE